MASVQSSVINLTKTIIGAGLLAMPFAIKADGVALGVALILFAAWASAYGLNIIHRCATQNLKGREASFFSLCQITYPELTLLFDFSMFIQCFGVALSYLVLIGDIVPGLIDNVLGRNQVILLSLVVTLPLVSLRKLDSLKAGSLIGLFAIAYLTVLVVSHFLFDDFADTERDLRIWTTGPWKDILSSFSIIVFAFTAAQNISTITNEIGDKTKLNTVVYTSIGIASVLFLLVGMSGYIQFGSKVEGNVMLNYDPDLLSSKIGKYSLVLMVTLSFPLMFHPCRISLNNMIHWVELKYQDAKINETAPLLSNQEPDVESEASHGVVPFSTNRFILLTTLLLATVYGLALSIDSFELVLALVGATGSTLICFTLPGLFGFKLFTSKYDRYWSLSLSVWGFLVMIICVYATLH